MVRRLSPALAIMLSEAAVETVNNCSDCGDCLDKCPYSLPIPETLRENQSYFKDFIARHSQS
jgi:predicted aldo/keto reductase-like oxidoreductase